MSHQGLSQVSSLLSAADSQDFVRNFLFGHSDINRGNDSIQAKLALNVHTEGWIGIPHGGIGMGAIMELAMMLQNYPINTKDLYPLSVDFRMGGSSVIVGNQVDVKVSPLENGASGSIEVDHDTLPYITALVEYKNDEYNRRGHFLSYMPGNFPDFENKLILLSHYNNCFVCGVERKEPGLKRCFYLLDTNQPEKIIVATAGFYPWDNETFYLFQRNSVIHPLVFLALLDEAMGWGGFMITASGSVTVRVGYTFYRDIHVGERIVVFGRGEKVRRSFGRLFFWASGGAAVIHNDGKLEDVIAASGQWLGVPDLTEQMKRELVPKNLTSRAFKLAGT
jgi:hypothetical protein